MADFNQQKQQVNGSQYNVGGDQHFHNYSSSYQANPSSTYQSHVSPEPITPLDLPVIIGEGIRVAVVTIFSIFFSSTFLVSFTLGSTTVDNRIILVIAGIALLLGIIFGISASKRKLRQIIVLRERGLCVKCGGKGIVKCPRRCIGGKIGPLNKQRTCPMCNGNTTIKCQNCLGTTKA